MTITLRGTKGSRLTHSELDANFTTLDTEKADLTDLAASSGSSLVGFIQSGTGAVARTVQDKVRETVSVFDFMSAAEIADVQARTLLVDVTTSTDAAVAYAKANKKRLRWPAGHYLRTLSLDGTFANDGSANFVMYGDGKGVTIIYGQLTEPYPIIDYTGNTRGELRDMRVESTGAAAQATCAFLSAKPTSGGSLGNTVTVENCQLLVPTSGNVNAIIGAVFYNTDLSKCINTECYGPAGATFGFTKPAGVSSKFAGSSSQTDSTNFFLDKGVFIGNAGPALEYTGGSALSIQDVYCALVGDGSSDVIKISSSSVSSGNCIYATNLRTENQSSATAVNAVFFEAKSVAGQIIGQLETDAAGAAVKIGSVTVANYSLNILRANGKIFAGNAIVESIRLNTNCTDIGDISASSMDISVHGDIAASNVLAQCINGVYVSKDGVYSHTGNVGLIPPKATSVRLRPLGAYRTANISPTAYTGGSGEQLIVTLTVPANILDQWDTQVTAPSLRLDIHGDMVAANANGRLRIEASQSGGGSTIDLLDFASAPAGTGAMRVSLTFSQISSANAIRCYAEGVLATAATAAVVKTKYTNMQSSSYLSTADITIKIYLTNDGNNGIRPLIEIQSMV